MILTSDYLEHHGILGQKWGIRRFQSYDIVPRKSGKGGQEQGAALKSDKMAGKISKLNAKGEKLTAKRNAVAPKSEQKGAKYAKLAAKESKAEMKLAKAKSRTLFYNQDKVDKLEAKYNKIHNKTLKPQFEAEKMAAKVNKLDAKITKIEQKTIKLGEKYIRQLDFESGEGPAKGIERHGERYDFGSGSSKKTSVKDIKKYMDDSDPDFYYKIKDEYGRNKAFDALEKYDTMIRSEMKNIKKSGGTDETPEQISARIEKEILKSMK